MTLLVNAHTVEPLNKGHLGTIEIVLYKEVSFIQRTNNTLKYYHGTETSVLYREVSFIQSIFYQRFHCTGILDVQTDESP